jgi:hypothetical protein
MTEPDSTVAAAPVFPVGPPPVGLIISSLLTWSEFSRTYPGLDQFWLPADGRPMPEGCRLARVLAAHGRPAAHLPDLRGAVLRGASRFDVPVDDTIALAAQAAGDAGVPTVQVYFYVRYN